MIPLKVVPATDNASVTAIMGSPMEPKIGFTEDRMPPVKYMGLHSKASVYAELTGFILAPKTVFLMVIHKETERKLAQKYLLLNMDLIDLL